MKKALHLLKLVFRVVNAIVRKKDSFAVEEEPHVQLSQVYLETNVLRKFQVVF